MSKLFGFRAIPCILCLIGAIALFPGCSDNGGGNGAKNGPAKKRIIVLNNTEDPYWDAARAGIAKAVEDLKLADKGISATMESNGNDEEKGQIEKLRQYGLQNDILAVVISPTSGSNPAIVDELKKLKDKGIIIGCIDSDLIAKYQTAREFYVGTDNLQGGKLLGTAARLIKPAGGEYVQFVGNDSQQNARDRMDGFTSAAGEKFTQKERKFDANDQQRARDNVRDVLDKYPGLSVLVGIWAYNAPAIVDVVKEKNARDKITIVTFDARPDAVEQMTAGMIDGMVVQDPFGMGYEAIRTVVAKLDKDQATLDKLYPNAGKPNGDVLDTGLKLVLPDGSALLDSTEFKTFGERTKVMPLTEFRDWLKTYDLKGS